MAINKVCFFGVPSFFRHFNSKLPVLAKQDNSAEDFTTQMCKTLSKKLGVNPEVANNQTPDFCMAINQGDDGRKAGEIIRSIFSPKVVRSNCGNLDAAVQGAGWGQSWFLSPWLERTEKKLSDGSIAIVVVDPVSALLLCKSYCSVNSIPFDLPDSVGITNYPVCVYMVDLDRKSVGMILSGNDEV